MNGENISFPINKKESKTINYERGWVKKKIVINLIVKNKRTKWKKNKRENLVRIDKWKQNNSVKNLLDKFDY